MMTFPLKIENRVHHVFQHTWSSQLSLLGHMTNDKGVSITRPETVIFLFCANEERVHSSNSTIQIDNFFISLCVCNNNNCFFDNWQRKRFNETTIIF